jgi:pyruvate dehydrogenase E1 component
MQTAVEPTCVNATSAMQTCSGPKHSNLTSDELTCLDALHKRVQWLSAWMIHHANHVRPNTDGLKVGGHQASSASLATVMTALYFRILRSTDRVAIKPHASPAYHAIQYLLGNQSREQLQRFRALGGIQAYPSRTKDHDDVDFSTGSVGLGVALTAFASLTQDYLLQKQLIPANQVGRMIALLGDAELDEGNIHEALIEGCKHDLRNTWWIIDYNRQSLDAVSADLMFHRFQEIFQATGWNVVTIKYGGLQQAAFREPGGERLRQWIDGCPNALYSALAFKGGAAWRRQLLEDGGSDPDFRQLIDRRDDDELHRLMINLGGHDIAELVRTFESVASDKPHCFIAYTIKGWGLPFQGHKDNHSGLMSVEQMDAYRRAMRVPAGQEWEPLAGLGELCEKVRRFLDERSCGQRKPVRDASPRIDVPDARAFPCPAGAEQSTQVAFGRIMTLIAREKSLLADRIITTSPDVTVSTNLGGWVNQRGIYHRTAQADTFSELHVASMQKWDLSKNGQHLELGIAENNMFLALAALGLSEPLFGQRLLPVGTLYDPFICRGLDALNYACYQDARFMLVATPSGVTLAPEGGAHQSVHTPLIGMGQDGLTYFEPAYVDELAEIMRWSFEHMQMPEGGSVYLRLSTRTLRQPERERTSAWSKSVLQGGYWRVMPGVECPLVIAYTGVVAPEAEAAFEQIREQCPEAGLLTITSPDRLHTGWVKTVRARRDSGGTVTSHIERMLKPLAHSARIVTVLDGTPETLSWLGAVCGHRCVPLGVDRFGESGDVPSLYRLYGIDVEGIYRAARQALAS